MTSTKKIALFAILATLAVSLLFALVISELIISSKEVGKLFLKSKVFLSLLILLKM